MRSGPRVGPANESLPALDAYRRYGPALIRKAERVLSNREDAGDVVQSLFVELVQRGPERLDLPYLYRAVTNRCLNLIRDRQNRARLLDQQQPALRGAARVRLVDAVVGLDLLVKLSARLDSKHMEVLVCRYMDDMTQDEIAELMRTSRKTIGRRLARIRGEILALAGAGPTGGAKVSA
jgi:RNA polymerase sigma-70 factor (ECF subfamily)